MARLMNPAQDTKTVGGVVEYYNEMTRQYAAATVTTGNPIGSASEETVLRNTGSSGAWGRALMNVSYDLATGRSVVQLAIPTKSISSGLVAGSGGTIAPVLSRIGKALGSAVDRALLGGWGSTIAGVGVAGLTALSSSEVASSTGAESDTPWTAEGVREILKMLDPTPSGRWADKVHIVGDRADHWWWVYAFTGMNYPTLNIEYNYDSYLDNITAHVPPNWTSLQVAEYLYKNIAGDKKLYEALLNESKNSSDVELAQQAARFAEYSKTAKEIAAALTELVNLGVSLIPGGTFVVSANEAYNGKYVGAAIGILGVIKWGKLAEKVGARIVFKEGPPVLLSQEAAKLIKNMAKEERAVLILELKGAKSAEAASKILKDLADIEIEAMHLLPQAERFAPKFKKAGLEIKDYLRPIEKALHRKKIGPGLHTNVGGNWNKVWDDFFKKYPKAKRQQILDQLAKMLKDFGLE